MPRMVIRNLFCLTCIIRLILPILATFKTVFPLSFSVASLLSSLHQLKEENLDLEDSVDRMVQRRDHLLAVRARLLALSSLTVNTERPSPERPTGPPSATSTPLQSQVRAVVETFFLFT